MATRNFSKMTTAKLQALLNTASEADKAEIQAVLDTRAQVAKAPKAEETSTEEAPAPETETSTEEAPAPETENKPKKMTEEELHALAEDLKKNVGHKCQVVPFNTIEWANGYIAGVIEEKRSMKVLYAIRTEDGRKIVKVYDSPYLKISEEVAEKATTIRTRREKDDTEWSQEDIDAGLDKLQENVGKLVTIDGIEGRITSIVPEKRARTFMYRIEYKTLDDNGEEVEKVMHKVHTNEGLVLAEDLDEVGKKTNESYIARRASSKARQSLSPEERIEKLKADVAAAEKQIESWTKRLEDRKAALAEAEKEYAESASAPETEENAPAQEAEESLD